LSLKGCIGIHFSSITLNRYIDIILRIYDEISDPTVGHCNEDASPYAISGVFCVTWVKDFGICKDAGSKDGDHNCQRCVEDGGFCKLGYVCQCRLLIANMRECTGAIIVVASFCQIILHSTSLQRHSLKRSSTGNCTQVWGHSAVIILKCLYSTFWM
jgi:hypothetical protein